MTFSRSDMTAAVAMKNTTATQNVASEPFARSSRNHGTPTSGRFLRISMRRAPRFRPKIIHSFAICHLRFAIEQPKSNRKLQTATCKSPESLVRAVRIHDVLHEPVADDVATLQFDHGDSLDAF